MNSPNPKETTEQICLEVFTKVSAIVTHEMRNALAIINEGAGYLEDLVAMTPEGAGVPVEKVQRQAGSIVKQVARANKLMKDVNQYAHSNDTQQAQVGARDLVTLMCELTRRKAAERRNEVVIDVPAELQLTTQPVVFLSALYFCLIGLYSSSTLGGQITVSGTRADQQLTLRFALQEKGEADLSGTVDERIQTLMDALEGQLNITADAIDFTCKDLA